MPEILPRSVMGTPEPPATRPKMAPKTLVLLGHYTGVSGYSDPAKELADVRRLASIAVGMGKAWEYSYVIGLAGGIYEMAGEYRAAHCLNFNDKSYGVLFLNGIGVPLTDAQTVSWWWLRDELVRRGQLSPAHVAVPHYRYRRTICTGSALSEPPGAAWDSPTGEGFLGNLVPPLLNRPIVPEPTPEPVPSDDMKPFLFRIVGYNNVFLMTSGGPIHTSAVLFDRFSKEGLDKVLVDNHEQFKKSVLTVTGLTEADLVPGGDADKF